MLRAARCAALAAPPRTIRAQGPDAWTAPLAGLFAPGRAGRPPCSQVPCLRAAPCALRLPPHPALRAGTPFAALAGALRGRLALRVFADSNGVPAPIGGVGWGLPAPPPGSAPLGSPLAAQGLAEGVGLARWPLATARLALRVPACGCVRCAPVGSPRALR
jgi:hypothetical protein